MRKLILLILSSAMLAGCAYVAIELLLFARIPHYRLGIGAAITAFAGGYLIWTDFLAPKLGIKTWED